MYEKVIVSPSFWRIISLNIKFKIGGFIFLSTLSISPHSSFLHGFCRDFSSTSNACSSLDKLAPSFEFLWRFSFCFFLHFECEWLRLFFFLVFVLFSALCAFRIYGFVVITNWKILCYYHFIYFYSHSLFPLEFPLY